MFRPLLAILLAFCAFLASYSHSSAQSPDCNQFETIQSVILSEATRQPFEAQLEIARVVVTKGACVLDEHFYSGYALANRIFQAHPDECIQSIHCRAYFMRDTIDPRIRESPALAAHVALTEFPRVPRFHFARFDSLAYWWDSPRACPNSWFIISETKVC